MYQASVGLAALGHTAFEPAGKFVEDNGDGWRCVGNSH